jgi:catalase
MPLPSDEKVVALAEQLLKQFDVLFGEHPGFRPTHAKGTLLAGTFSASREAASLTRAPHIARESTPVLVRFSDTTGIPLIPDNDPNANPRGMGIRFMLGEHAHTDIIAHSTPEFPVKNGAEFLELLRALGSADPSAFIGSHPATAAFVKSLRSPSSFAREAYFAISAFRFTNKDGVSRFGRYRVVPQAGVEVLDDAAAKSKDGNYLFEDLARRISAGGVSFDVLVQVANEQDVVNDSTIHWLEDRAIVNFGKITLTAKEPDDAHEQKKIIFDPLPRVDGIEATDDPLFELRAALYLLSGRRRREAPESAVDAIPAKAGG